MKKLFLLISLLLALSFKVKGDSVFINEISVCNITKHLDPNYDFTGWIELYNSTGNDIAMQNLYFSDEKNNPKKYKLTTARTLPAHGYAIVWLNDEVTSSDIGYSLDSDADDGGFFSVADNEGNIYDSLVYPVQYPDISYGRTIDGDTSSPLGYFFNDSYCRSNNGNPTGTAVVATPTFSQKSGFYGGRVSVTMSCATQDATIRYTLDSTEPNATSTIYDGTPLLLDSTTVLRARAYKEGLLNGIAATATYMIKERKPEMPIAFVVCDSAYLQNDSIGIYCTGTNGIMLTAASTKANFNRDWTRAAHFTLMDSTQNILLSQPVGIAISGNFTREFPQKSLKIKGQTKFGKKRFDEHQIFPSQPGIRTKSFILRNGGQKYVDIQLLHDACIESMLDVTPIAYQAAEPAATYINGKYWGIYNMRERSNDDLVYSRYGYSETDIDFLEWNWALKAHYGTKANYQTLENLLKNSDLTTDENYRKVCDLVDMDNFLYYMSANILAVNTDWPANNQRMFYPRTNGKWRWIIQDMDNSFSADNDTYKALVDNKSTKLPYKMLPLLMANENCKERYVTIQSIVAGSVFRPDRFKARKMAMKSRIENEYPYYASRWPTQVQFKLSHVDDEIKYEANHCRSIYSYLSTNFSLGKVVGLNVYSSNEATPVVFNGVLLPVMPYEGGWFKGKPLEVTAPLYDCGKKFAYWEISTRDGARKDSNCTLKTELNDTTSIKAVYENADLVRRDGLYINEISADNSVNIDASGKYEDWVEIYNSSTKEINLAGYYLSNSLSTPKLFKFGATNAKATTVPALGRVIVWCSKKPERGILHTNFKLPKDGGSLYLSDESGTLVDSIRYSAHDFTKSFGRYPDGAETLVTFDNPSFYKPNLYSANNIFGYVEEYRLVSGISPVTLNSAMVLYADNLNGELVVQTNSPGTLRIIDISGKLIKAFNIIATDRQNLDITGLQAGVYIAVFDNGTLRKALKFIR